MRSGFGRTAGMRRRLRHRRPGAKTHRVHEEKHDAQKSQTELHCGVSMHLKHDYNTCISGTARLFLAVPCGVRPVPRKPRWWLWLADGFLLFVIATILVHPLYRAEYLSAWNSIESTFIADAR